MRYMRNARVTRSAAGLAVAGLTASLALTGPAAQAATPQATSSSNWLVTQISAGLVQSEYRDFNGNFVSYTDHGLSLDFYFAFDQLGVRAGQQERIVDALEPEIANYTGSGSAQYAGAIGKLLTAVQDQGIAVSSYGGGNLLTRLERRVQDSGPEQGRGKDAFDPTDPFGGDFSNTFGQSFVVTALTNAGSAEADDAIRFLLKQQCAAGFFRESMDSADFTCDGAQDSRPDVDATATVAIALNDVLDNAPASVSDEARDSMRQALRWLASQQLSSGTFSGASNTNSTGLAAAAFAETGRTNAATKAARWVNKFRVTSRMARRTALGKADVGAIAYDGAALSAGKKRGITRAVRYEWRRATAQAAPALDAL